MLILSKAIIQIMLVLSVGLMAEISPEKLGKCQNFTPDVISNWDFETWLKKEVAENGDELLSSIIESDAVDLFMVLLDDRLDVNRIIEVKNYKTNNKSTNVTVLSYASLFNASRIVKLLTNRNASLEFRIYDHGYTPLMYAVAQTHLNIVNFLLRHGASVHVVVKDGLTVLHLAVLTEDLDVIKVLKENGADTEAKTLRAGLTPLMLAVVKGKNCSVQCLLDVGADKSLKNKNGKTAEDLAFDLKQEEIVRILSDEAQHLKCNCF